MKELLRSNDPVWLSYVAAMLAGAGVEVVMFDLHASIVEGSIGALPRRLMVADEDWEEAVALLALLDPPPDRGGPGG